jgi:hypothetical protein
MIDQLPEIASTYTYFLVMDYVIFLRAGQKALIEASMSESLRKSLG